MPSVADIEELKALVKSDAFLNLIVAAEWALDDYKENEKAQTGPLDNHWTNRVTETREAINTAWKIRHFHRVFTVSV